MESAADLQRSVSQHSRRSISSRRSATVRRTSRPRQGLSHPSSSASSIAASDKSLTSFPSFSPESPALERFASNVTAASASTSDNDHNHDRDHATPRSGDRGVPDNGGFGEEERLRTATQESSVAIHNRGFRSESIVDSLTGGDHAVRESLFEDSPVTKIPGALHMVDDSHIERLIRRHGAVGLVRQIAEDLAQRDAQMSALRRRAEEREKALRRIIRECAGLSQLELETRLRVVEGELRESGRARGRVNSGLSDMMSDAMHDTLSDGHNRDIGLNGPSTIRARNGKGPANDGKGTSRGWKEFIWGTGTAKKNTQETSSNDDSINPSEAMRSHSSLERRPVLKDDLFNPPESSSSSQLPRSLSRASLQSHNIPERKASGSLASYALRLVAGGAISTRETGPRGRAFSSSVRGGSARAASSSGLARASRSTSVASGPKALMAMRRPTQVLPTQPSGNKSQGQEMWETMVGSPPSLSERQESYGPVELDAILPPETQPPTLTHLYKNYDNSEYLTDRFGFIYDQRRKKRQREAAQMANHIRKGSRAELLINSRAAISPNSVNELPSPKWSVSSEGRPASPSSADDNINTNKNEDSPPKRWQDYLKAATFPTELLSHTPGIGAPSLEVLEGAETPSAETPSAGSASQSEVGKSPAITPTEGGLMPLAMPTTAVDSEPSPPSQPEPTQKVTIQEDREPVRLLLQQLSDVHDALQREKTPRWNDFLRKVRAERRREGEAAIAAANAVAEARFERPAVILPETRVADGEMIGVSNLGHKGKVGRNKWNEFKNLVLGGIPVEYRSKVWSECSGAVTLRVPGYYDDMVLQSTDDDDPTVVGQIQMDIHRTLTDNIFFRKGPGVHKLKEILVAYARRNKDVGYCQGMNLIAANLLLIMPSAEDAFWVLAAIVETILPQGYYDHSLRSSRADQQVLRQYVTEVLPKLSAHLDSLSIELEALTFQWFLSVFTDCLCAEALFRVWDVVLCTNDGSTFLFQVALALLKLNEGNLLQCTSPASVYTYIGHQMTEHAISIDGLMQASDGLKKVVRREEVELRRQRAVQADMDNVAAAAAADTLREQADQDLSIEEPRPIEE